MKLTKNADLDKCKYAGYGIGFDSRSFDLQMEVMKKNIIIFGADMRSSVHVDNNGKNVLILSKEPTQGLDDTALPEEANLNYVFVLRLHYNGSNSFLFVNATKVYQFKAKNSEIKDYALFLGNISKDFTINNMKKLD